MPCDDVYCPIGKNLFADLVLEKLYVEGSINGWNANVAELTRLSDVEAMGKSLIPDLVFRESEENSDKLVCNECFESPRSTAQNLAVDKATAIATSTAIKPQMASIMGNCEDGYNDALDNYMSAMDALGAPDVGIVNSMLSTVITDFSDCDDGLNGLESPVLEFDGTLTKMTSNCLAIALLMQ
ncbi:phytochrome B [Actinidia rufa]|uniref:Phytochrome B n=1 Tax=Actinidia rufa TaxID=165716 RepID=A0A7J0GKZ0_9ERIC|nr:phytochrome B [Actinidia rufa]